jgi:hypothetical protein
VCNTNGEQAKKVSQLNIYFIKRAFVSFCAITNQASSNKTGELCCLRTVAERKPQTPGDSDEGNVLCCVSVAVAETADDRTQCAVRMDQLMAMRTQHPQQEMLITR